MADVEQLKRAFMKAHKAGDTKAAAALARAIKSQNAGAPIMPEMPAAAPKPETVASGSFLPISRDSAGNVGFDSNAGIVGVAKRGLQKLVGPIYGEGSPVDEQGRPSQQMIEGAADLAPFASPVSPALRAGEAVIPGVANTLRKPTNLKPPSAEALRSAGAQGYDAARKMGVRYNSQAVAGEAGKIRLGLEQDGILAELAPKTFKIVEKLSNPPANSTAPLEGLVAARRALQNARLDFTNPTEKLAAERVIKQLDEFIGRSDPASVVDGPASTAAKTLGEANANYAASKRSNLVTGKLDKADRQAAVANSGLNIENTIRQRANDVLNSEKLQKGFTKAELAMIRKVAEGSKGRNTLRYVGNLLGGGGGLGAMLTGAIAGGMTGSSAPALVGAGVMGGGYAAKKAGGALTRRAMQGVDLATRRRSPLYQQMLLDAPLEPMATGLPSAAVRGGLIASPSALDMLFQREKL